MSARATLPGILRLWGPSMTLHRARSSWSWKAGRAPQRTWPATRAWSGAGWCSPAAAARSRSCSWTSRASCIMPAWWALPPAGLATGRGALPHCKQTVKLVWALRHPKYAVGLALGV